MTEQYPTSVPELTARIEQHRRALMDYVDALPPQVRDEQRDPAGWSAKDHIAHLAAWERSMIALLSGKPRHAGLGVSESVYLSHDVDRINAEIYAQHRDLSWETVRSDFDRINQELVALLGDHSWEELWQPYSHFLPDEPRGSEDAETISYIAGNTFFHFDLHAGWIRELTGTAR